MASFRKADDVDARSARWSPSVGTTFHALHAPTTPEGFYSLSYTNLVMPLINATKELKAENDTLKAEIDALKSQMAAVLQALGK